MLYHVQNPHGGEVYSHPVMLDFSANINPLGTPEAVQEAVKASVSLLFQYPDPYCRALVQAIAQYESVSPDTILCGNGAAELIFSLCNALKPKKALLPVPSFSEYRSALEAAECQTEYFFLKEADNFALTPEFLPALKSFDGQLVMLCNPNNPTGQVISPALLRDILDICREKYLFLFVDECFLDLTEGGEELSLKGLLGEYPDVLLLKAFTKSFGMAGLRLGYCLCGNPGLLRRMGERNQAWNVSSPAQMAGVAALRERDFLNRARGIIQAERPRMTAALEAMGLRVIPSKVNYLLFRSEKELRAPLLTRGIQIRDCSNYPGLEEGWYRTAVKLPQQNTELLNAIKEVLNG